MNISRENSWCRTALAVAIGGLVSAFVVTASFAQATADKYPDKPIRIIVPFAPGGSVDIVARVIGQKMTEAGDRPSSSRRGQAPER